MPPELDALQVTHNESTKNTVEEEQPKAECSLKELPMSRKQLRRKKSSSALEMASKSLPEPMSPSSSSSTVDTTFEPTIDLLVNDFDDLETLNEEEALAALEFQDPQDEISKLQEESEMPIEELLARYGSGPPAPTVHVKKKVRKDVEPGKRGGKPSEQKEVGVSAAETPRIECSKVIVIESGDEDNNESVQSETTMPEANSETQPLNENSSEPAEEAVNRKRRSHLLDLYPEETFINTATQNANENEEYSAEEDDDGTDSDEEADTDSNYGKKTIMVGVAYQAAIPNGLSQYGDILPYENEDKLIWEPSQVSEREVEDYLLKAGEIKPTLSDSSTLDETGEKVTVKDTTNVLSARRTQPEASDNRDISIASSFDSDSGVVKDNEQALHLLVQCGYDFKEALRRKRLNAVPLTGSMSLWSEDECNKFEEGIQNFGKDFLKIRQNQVRTRTMRELVQFYYLWKKSERRDHNFANANTVDHMDIYLNESDDYNTNAAATPAANSLAHTNRKSIGCMPNNFSIFTGSANNFSGSGTVQPNCTVVDAATSMNRRRSATGNGSDCQVVGKSGMNCVIAAKQV